MELNFYPPVCLNGMDRDNGTFLINIMACARRDVRRLG